MPAVLNLSQGAHTSYQLSRSVTQWSQKAGACTVIVRGIPTRPESTESGVAATGQRKAAISMGFAGGGRAFGLGARIWREPCINGLGLSTGMVGNQYLKRQGKDT